MWGNVNLCELDVIFYIIYFDLTFFSSKGLQRWTTKWGLELVHQDWCFYWWRLGWCWKGNYLQAILHAILRSPCWPSSWHGFLHHLTILLYSKVHFYLLWICLRNSIQERQILRQVLLQHQVCLQHPKGNHGEGYRQRCLVCLRRLRGHAGGVYQHVSGKYLGGHAIKKQRRIRCCCWYWNTITSPILL